MYALSACRTETMGSQYATAAVTCLTDSGDANLVFKSWALPESVHSKQSIFSLDVIC